MRYTQPQSGPVQIDWSNPITRGLKDARIPVGRGDLVAVSSPTIVAGKPGVGFKGNGTSSYWRSVGTKSVSATADHTIFAIVQGAVGIDARAYALADAGTLIIQLGAGASNALKLRLWVRSPGADVGAVDTSATVFEAAIPHAVALRYRPGLLESFVDGVADVTSVGTTVGGSVLAETGIGALVRGGSPAAYSAATLFIGLFWDRALSNAELASISANPWQLFRSPQRVWSAAAGGTDTPVNPGVGALALTGYAPSVTQSANLSLTPGAGSIGITGFAPTIAQPNTISPSAGSLAITGYAPTVTQAANQAVTPGTGSLALSGYAPAVTQTAGQWVVPGAGLLTISGFAPTVTQPQTIAPGLGSLAITGYAPTVTQAINQSILPGAGTLALSGYAPSIAQSSNQLAQPAAGSLSLTGYAPLVAQSVNQSIAPSVGSLTITGFAPTVGQASASPNLQLGAWMLSIVGYAPTIEQRNPSASVGGGGAGDWRAARAYADRLDKASRPPKPTKAAKKKRREQLEVVALELLPDLPAARLIAPVIAQAVYRKEAAAVARWTPPRAMLPVIKPNANAVEQAADLEAEALAAEFDAAEAIRAMVEQWQRNEAIAHELEREADEESEIEMLLLG